MPELPEVQTVVNDLKSAGLVGAEFLGARIYWHRTISGITPKVFRQKIRGKTISAIRRRGKFIVFDLFPQMHLLIHLRMTGRIILTQAGGRRSKHEHVFMELDDHRQLCLQDTRKFGRIYIVSDPETILGRLGPEPLSDEFTAGFFAKRLGVRKRLIKPLLLDQAFIAGIGNIYADESLWEAKIHPRRISSSLSRLESRALHRAIPKVLCQGLKNMGTSLGRGKTNFFSVSGDKGRNRDHLKVFRREGLPCPRCKKSIKRMVVGQRSTFVCETCQIC